MYTRMYKFVVFYIIVNWRYLPQDAEVPHAAVSPNDVLSVYCYIRCCRFGLNERCNVNVCYLFEVSHFVLNCKRVVCVRNV